MESRFMEVRAEGRSLLGMAMPYGDIARTSQGNETFRSGAFGDVSQLDILATVQHDRGRHLARTGGGGLELLDTPESLQVVANLPGTREADDALELVKKRILRGWSVEFGPRRVTQESGLRVIEDAELGGISLVDKPAYPLAIAEIRQEGEGLAGRFLYNEDMIVSDTDRRRKQRIAPGAFTFALEAPDREVNLVLGSPDRPLASKQAGSLKLRDTPTGLLFNVPRLPRTSYATDFLALLTGRAIVPGLVPFFLIPPRPGAEGEEEEKGNPGVFPSPDISGPADKPIYTIQGAKRQPWPGPDKGRRSARLGY